MFAVSYNFFFIYNGFLYLLKFYYLLEQCDASETNSRQYFCWMFLFDMNVFNKQVRQGLRINIPFERGCKNDHLSLWTFKDNLFDLNSVETLSSSTAILAKSVAMLLWERDKYV